MKSIRVSVSAAVVAASVILIPPTQAAMLTALSSFGGGDGWLAPGDRTYLANDNNQRGLAYNPTTGHVLLVNRTGGLSVNVMDGATGADLGALTGVGTLTGGTFAGSMIGVAGDGAVYVANLTVNSTTSPFKIYRWANETSASPTVAFSGNPLAGSRIGDTLDALGSGTDTLLVAGYGSTPVVAGNNSFAMFSTADGSNYASTHISVGTTPPNAGDFRLGITFLDSDTVIGKQSSISLGGRVVDVTGAAGTLNTSFALSAAATTPMDYAIVGGVPLLAAVNTAADGQSMVWVYDMTNPATPTGETWWMKC